MPTDRVVFRHALEGLLKVVPEERLDAELRVQLLAVGVDLDKPLQGQYPLETWVKFSGVLAQALYPNIPTGEAHRLLGRRLAEGYFQTFIGKALLPMLKLIGPKRAVLRTERNFRSANNYTQTRFEEVGPTKLKMWLNETQAVPEYTAGIVEAGMTAAGALEVVVEVLERDSDGCWFKVEWSESSAGGR